MPFLGDDGAPPAPPRLMITKMVLENFKSYAGIREIGPFHKCFSSIVGPNGSGKSNVIDAMLFVFGKRAKKLRLNKVSELIHKSSAVKDAQSAQVSVYFQDIIDTGSGDDDYIVVPDTETVVTRTARKDNSSTYKLNGKACSFKEVADFLGGKGIDLDNNRFLILQGEVEMISMMAPKGKTEHDEGLLEYLEDIIGSNTFVADTNVAAEKVDALTEQRQEKLNRVKAVEQEKDSLEGAKLEAEALLQKEREIRRKQNILYQLYALKYSRQASDADESKKVLDQKLDDVRKELADAAARVDEIGTGMSKQRKEYEQIHSSLQQTKDEFAAYERRDIKLREDLKLCKAQTKKLDAKIKKEDQRGEEALQAIGKANESIPMLVSMIQDLKDKKKVEDEKLEGVFDEMKDATDNMRALLETKTNELAPLQQERAIFLASLETAQTEAFLLTDSVKRNQEQLDSAEKELASLDECQSRKRRELSASQDQLDAAKNKVEDLEKEDKQLECEEQTLNARNKKLLVMMEESKAVLQAKGGAAGGSEAVKGILRAARKGGELANVGIVGRLGDLASVDDKYDIAVSTACTMLDHIVVQTTAGAQRCLTFLRQHGLGRANFIPLDKMKKGAHDRAVETPEGAPRLFELIHPANFSVTPALFLGVGNTLVAPDLETATRWAYDFDKRWRVVTLDGQLIETSGTMAGGGKSARKGGMRLKNSVARKLTSAIDDDDSVNDIKEIEEQAKNAVEELKTCRQRRRNIVLEILSLKKEIKALGLKLPRLTLEIEGFDTTRTTLTESIPELRSQCELCDQDQEKLVKLEHEVEKRKTAMSSCALQTSKLESEVARLQKSILEAGGPKLKKQQALCDKVLTELDITEKKLNEARVAISTNEKVVAKAKAAKLTTEVDLEKLKATTQEKLQEFKALEEGALEVMEKYEEVKVLEAEKHAALEEVSKEIEHLKKSQSTCKGTEIEVMGQVAAFEKQLSDLEKKRLHWEAEIDKVHAAESEDDEFDASDDEGDDDDRVSEEERDHEMVDEPVLADVCGDKPSGLFASRHATCLPRFEPQSLEQYREEDVKAQIGVLENEKATLAKNANMGAIAEYRKKEADYLSRVTELDSVTEERNQARKIHEELRRMRLEKFMDGFGQITLKLKEMYQMITLGGDAELELVDSLDPFSEGIVFSVRPPKKSWKNIANLSGGEKTLSSLALVFALHHFKPTPLYVMDEIDAALDFKNVSIVANYIKERTKNAQFIIISLRNNMFELADRLVGVYKTNNCTKSVTIDPRAFGVSSGQSAPLVDRTNMESAHGKSGKSMRDSTEPLSTSVMQEL